MAPQPIRAGNRRRRGAVVIVPRAAGLFPLVLLRLSVRCVVVDGGEAYVPFSTSAVVGSGVQGSRLRLWCAA
ncbi:MAG TPA: hypothetical protein VFE00_02990 [Arthrobacter sp.]|nr:hypothetical protein [Arthrobacter sp.]